MPFQATSSSTPSTAPDGKVPSDDGALRIQAVAGLPPRRRSLERNGGRAPSA